MTHCRCPCASGQKGSYPEAHQGGGIFAHSYGRPGGNPDGVNDPHSSAIYGDKTAHNYSSTVLGMIYNINSQDTKRECRKLGRDAIPTGVVDY